MVEVLRNKWCEDLEDLLQCPVCFERPAGIVYQCEAGHHICSKCEPRVPQCPMCQSRFNKSRSYLAENLSGKLDDIKLSLLNPSHGINQIVPMQLTNGNSSGNDSSSDRSSSNQRRLKPPKVAKGGYPCRMANCHYNLAHGLFISHLRYYHKDKFTEVLSPIENGTYREAWQIEYHLGLLFDAAIHIKKLGLFFLNLEIDTEGNFLGSLSIVNSNYAGKMFDYTLSLSTKARTCSYNANVMSCRKSREYLKGDSLNVSSAILKRMTEHENTLTCSLELHFNPDAHKVDQNQNNNP